MMKKKLITAALLAVFSINSFAFAADTVDFSTELSELKNLLQQCETLGISTDYESMTCAVLEKYNVLINNDLENNHPGAQPGVGFMREMYSDTAAKLRAYINGEAKPIEGAAKYDSFDVTASGTSLFSGGRPFYSIGVGHFEAARSDIPVFPSMGITNIQTEFGITKLTEDMYGWTEVNMGADSTMERVTLGNGNNIFVLKNNTPYDGNKRVVYYKYVDCKPNTKYKFGLKAMGTVENNQSFWLSAADGEAGRQNVTGLATSFFNEYSTTYTSGAEQKELYLMFGSYGVSELRMDNFYVYELDENGKTVGENLIENGDLESDDRYSTSLRSLTKALKNAEENNVGVCLLLSPHYFPKDLDEDLYSPNGFIGYNVSDPRAKAVVEKYLRTLLPRLKDYKAITSICLTNEPTFNTTSFYDYYNSLFQQYLESVHGDIATLNSHYGTSYKSFSEVNMPKSLTSYSPVCYDWIEFNDRTFADWHKWMADIVKEYLPDMPLHSKFLGNYITTGKDDAKRELLQRGTDIEMFDEFSDYAGNDALDWFNQPNFYYATMFLYDYQHSATNKPVYDTEEHMIGDREENFNIDMRRHVRNNLWQGAIHGRNLSSVWVWDKSYDPQGSLYGGIGFRPDAAAELGKTSLDLSRLAYDVNDLNVNKPRTAIFYSKATRLYDATYSDNLLKTYKALLNMGEKVGVVSDTSIDQLSKYDVLIIPGAGNALPKTLAKVNEFADNGGKVIYTGDAFAKDQYNKKADNSVIKSKGYTYSVSTAADDLKNLYKDFDMIKFELLDENGNALSDVDWQYSIDGNNFLINASLIKVGAVKNAYVYADGEMVSNLKNLLTNESGIECVELVAETPVLLSGTLKRGLNDEIDNLSADGNKLTWNFRKGSGTAYIYALEDGIRNAIGKTSGTEFTVPSAGTYFVRSASGGVEGGSSITVTDSMPYTSEIDKYNISAKSCMAEITAENIGDEAYTGVILAEAYGENDERLGFAYCKTTQDSGESTSVKFIFPTSARAKYIKASVVDSVISKKALSEPVVTEAVQNETEAE